MSFLYLKRQNDTKTLRRVEKLLALLPDSVKSLFRVINREELAMLGCDPKVALAIEPIPGVDITNKRDGEVIQPCTGGTHGYSCGADHTALVAFGAGVKHEEKAAMKQTDIKRFILDLLY